MLPLSNILLATDLSNSSKFAFQLAQAIARDFDAKLVIVHVSPPPVMLNGEGLIPAPIPVSTDYLRESLEKLVAEASLPRVEFCLLEGDASAEVLRVAQELKADLIVMGTHGRTGLSRLLMGSVAEQVLRRASCPVLTVKTPIPQSSPTEKPQRRTAVTSK